MREKIEVIIDNIYSGLQHRNPYPLSLIDGEAGCSLFDKCYLEYHGNRADEMFQSRIQQLAENSIGYSISNYCHGKSGINWFFAYLHASGILDDEDLETISYDDHTFINYAISLVKEGKYDFLQGALGVAYQLLYWRGSDFKPFFADLFKVLKEQFYNDKNELFIVDYNFLENSGKTGRSNLGLAHGLPSILKFCVQCFKQGICSAEAKAMAIDIISFIRGNQNIAGATSVFPNYVVPGKASNDISRLAWCYGDLGIGYILYQAGLAFMDVELQTFALETLTLTTNRKVYESTWVNDAGFCHGSAGIAHIYNRMWHYTKLPVFKEACDFWIEKTLAFSKYEDGLAGFKTYFGSDHSFINSYGLLEGISGIGLVLISYITGDFTWDYCLMLND